MIKRLVLLITTALVLAMPAGAYAASAVPNCGSGSASGKPQVCQELSNSSGDPILKVIKGAIEVISFIAGALAVIFIVAAALRFTLAGGDANAVATARNNLLYALAGIVVVGMAQAIVTFVLNRV